MTTITRRHVLALGAATAFVQAAPALSAARFAPCSPEWRTFELTTRVRLDRAGRTAQAWIPVPSLDAPDWSRPGPTRWDTNASEVVLRRDAASGAAFVHAVWPEGEAPATLDVVSSVTTRDRSVDPAGAGAEPLSPEEWARHLAPTELIPTDGIVAETAAGITAGKTGDLEKARAIYDWVVETTTRNPETRGCGLGDVASMLHSGNLTGKCADLNALFVGLARAAGLPARDLYGLRVAPSAFGYKSLGAGSSNVTGAQHCRADVFIEGAGWVPADPADVRKVILEEPPRDLELGDPEVRALRAGLFGAAEGNWVPLNDAHDVALPGSSGAPVPFLMYPQAEIGGVRRDELDPERFAYEILAAERTG
ncbi:transglutaminase-like domain-containing protein [Roseivivax sp. THAF30]|uniref:transglutaminase-like domain-containing protein n=1 Tax=Roseivivax sp. THAF30 TaxID=2587852 RepID=UPI001267898C|nr:transglutaminase-like domain-containing protein [Roseivivax sp. THAF30]QFT62132.1 Transglutaminase-like superfamily protein [Roseivivax sp. THAF30]